MRSTSQQLDRLLLDLAWSLWTELGIAGASAKHRNCLITPEELVVLTVALADTDPRLRDESLDWCSQYHHFVSVSRLKTIMHDFEALLAAPFSTYAATLNHICPKAGFPLYGDAKPLNFRLSRKSCLRPKDSPALLNIRARGIFSTGARADLVSFFLTHPHGDFAASDLTEIGYSKRNLAEILDQLNSVGLLEKFMVRNQNRYRLHKSDSLIKVLEPIPKHAPAWRSIFHVLLSWRACLKRIEKAAESTQVIEIRNQLSILGNSLQRLRLTPPPFHADFKKYLHLFSEWLLETVHKVADAKIFLQI